MSSQLIQIQQQNAVFLKALQSGQITQAQYNEAMAYQNQLTLQAYPSQYASRPESAQPKAQPTVQNQPATVTPVPESPSLDQYGPVYTVPKSAEIPSSQPLDQYAPVYTTPESVAQPNIITMGPMQPATPPPPIPTTPIVYPPQYAPRPESAQPSGAETVTLPQGATLLDVTPTKQGFNISYIPPPPLNSYPPVYTKPISIQLQENFANMPPVYTKPLSVQGAPPTYWTQEHPATAPLQATPASTEIETPTSLFGPSIGYWKNGQYYEQVGGLGVDNPNAILQQVKIDPFGGQASTQELRAIMGMQAVSVLGIGIATPITLAGAGIAVGGGEAYKIATTGKHLTPYEAISLAGLGELATLGVKGVYDFAGPKIQARVQASQIGQDVQAKLNDYYTPTEDANTRPYLEDIRSDLSLKERIAGKIGGLQPEKPALGIDAQPTIPTAPKEAWIIEPKTSFEAISENKITFKGLTPDEFQNMQEYGNLQGKIVTNEYLVEKLDTSSLQAAELAPKMQAGMDLDTWTQTPNTVAFGRSVDPYQYMEETTRMQPTGEWQPKVYYKGVPVQPQPPKEPLSFDRYPNQPRQIDYSRYGDFTQEEKIGLLTLAKAKPETAYWTVPERSIDYQTKGTDISPSSFAPLNLVSQKPLTEEPTLKTVSPTTTLTDRPVQSQMIKNPFLLYNGRQANQQIMDEQITYLSVPESGLPHPQQPKFMIEEPAPKTQPRTTMPSLISQLAQPKTKPFPLISQPAQPSKFTPQITAQTPIGKPKSALGQIYVPSTELRQEVKPIPSLLTTPTFTPTQVMPTPQKTTQPTPPPLSSGNLANIWPMLPGSKTMEFGGNKYEPPTIGGILSIKRQYPIKTPEEFFIRMKKRKNFLHNKSGIAYIWIVAGATIVFIPVIYWVLSVLLDSLSTSVFAMYTFSGLTASAWLLVKTIISFLPAICLFVILLWAGINAKARSYDS